MIRLAKMLSGIEEEWLSAAVFFNTTDEVEVLQATKTQHLTWWDFGLELLT